MFQQKLKNTLFVSNFLNFSLYEKLNPDIIILSDITWYILPELKKFIKWRPKLHKLSKIVKSCVIWEKKIK